MAVKKLLAMLILAGFLCGTVVGCGGTTTEKAKPAPTTPPAGDKDKKPDGEK
jgi:hypothetical protein